VGSPCRQRPHPAVPRPFLRHQPDRRARRNSQASSSASCRLRSLRTPTFTSPRWRQPGAVPDWRAACTSSSLTGRATTGAPSSRRLPPRRTDRPSLSTGRWGSPPQIRSRTTTGRRLTGSSLSARSRFDAGGGSGGKGSAITAGRQSDRLVGITPLARVGHLRLRVADGSRPSRLPHQYTPASARFVWLWQPTHSFG